VSQADPVTRDRAPPSDLDRHVEVVPELCVAIAHKEIPMANIGQVDDQRSTWLQVGTAEPSVLR
jgi:hypothetical protein